MYSFDDNIYLAQNLLLSQNRIINLMYTYRYIIHYTIIILLLGIIVVLYN